MRLRWSATSREDREQLYNYIRADSPAAAKVVDDRIVSHARRLLQFPGSGRPGRVADTKELPVPGTSHILVYRVLPGIIRIVRVIHTARQWPEEFSEEPSPFVA
jgi:addiction module RelE/StbE family toxin